MGQWCVVVLTSENTTEILNTLFLFPNTCQLQTASWLWVGPHIYFSSSLSVLWFCLVWTYAGLLSAAIVSVSSHEHQSLLLERHYLLGFTHHLWLWQSFHILFHIDSWVFRRLEWWRYIYDWALRSLWLSAHCPVVYVCVTAHLLKEASLIWAEQCNALICGYRNMSP